LGAFFHHAKGCIIGSVADGLNLVAKEYLARNRGNGVLLISPQTGAYPQLEKFALTIDPYDINQMADQFLIALKMSDEDKLQRAAAANKQLSADTVEGWWERFSAASGLEQPEQTQVA
jgi:trehalose 6-phosphate synthase